MTIQESVIFREEQSFTKTWVMGLVIMIAALMWWGFIQQIVLGEPWGSDPAPDWFMWLFWLVFGIGFPLGFLRMKLVIEVQRDVLQISYWPFSKRIIAYNEIERVQARSYQPIREYGGWGIKGWSKNRMAYNVKGKQGVELFLMDGRTVMLGSQYAPELEKAITLQMRS